MRKNLHKISAVAIAALIMVTMLLTGCGGLFSVKVTDISVYSEIELRMGDTVDLDAYVTITPAKASNKSYTAESADPGVVKVVSRSYGGGSVSPALVAVGVGETKVTVVTANGLSDWCNVTVTYADPSELTVSVSEDVSVISDTVIAYVGDDDIEFTATLNAGADPESEVKWSDGGSFGAVLPASQPYCYSPAAAGSFTVTASASLRGTSVASDSIKVNVYDSLPEATMSYDSALLDQNTGSYKTVDFTVDCEALSGDNPAPVIDWLVNGEICGTGVQFSYTPTAPGKYKIQGRINGEIISTGGEDGATIAVKGTITPQNVWVDYDNCYPKVYVRWDPIPSATCFQVSILDKETGREVARDLHTSNSGARGKFTDSSFDATDYMTGAYNIFSNRFSVRVKTLDDGILSESGWSKECVTDKVPARAEKYLSQYFYDGARNNYVRSYEEFYEWFEYAMLWRPAGLMEGISLYLDYDYGDARNTIKQAMEEMHFTGLYTYNGFSDKLHRAECTFQIEFRTDSIPSERTLFHSGEAWGSLRPHVNYDQNKVRSSRYVFPIDELVPVSVETSDQLYYVAQLGFRPSPIAGSTAEKLYGYARRVLRYIITEDMTDLDKIHAIYDWIMWRVTYDNEALLVTDIASAVKYESYYLESVFTDTYHYGVCDAMSKAFVLMCAVEGIESVRVTGTAGNGLSRGGHAWNKVKLYGQWYVVDCTWGDASIQIMPGGAYRESASHLYFLLSDSDIKETHAEDENSRFPATAKTRYPWYDEDIAYGSGKIDFYLAYSSSGENTLRSELNTLAEYMSDKVNSAERTYSVGPNPTVNRTNSQYYAFEIVADSHWGNDENSALQRVFADVMKKHGYVYNSSYYLNITTQNKLTHMIVFFRI